MKKQNLRLISWIMAIVFVVGIFANSVFAIPVQAVSYAESTYEAESAYLNGVGTNTNHTGYTGSGFVDGFDAIGDYVQFTVSIPATGDYSFIFKYANNTGYKASRKVYVDGNYIATAVFPNLANWDTWGKAEAGITNLASGTHTVKISFNNYAINLDNLVVEEKHESIRSLYLSNWNNMMAIWKASKLCSVDTATKGPRIDELRYSGNWSVNQIKDYSGFFRDETSGIKYNDGTKFDSEGYYDENGILRSNYLKYNGNYPSNLEFSRDYAMIPNQNFIVAKYSIKNTGSTSKSVNILDMLHGNNTTTNNISASYDSSRKALIINMSNAGQYYLALGAFSTPTGYQVANDTITNPSSANCSPWITFDNNGSLRGDTSVTCQDISVGFNQVLTVNGGTTANVYFYLALGTSSTDINTICDTAKAQTGEYWFNSAGTSYSSWFSNAKSIPALSDSDLTTIYKRNLIMVKNCIRPGSTTADGAMPATTNPYAYSYKVWTRDSATTAFGLDAAGFTSEGEKYWRWLAARQLTGTDAGKFSTCINLWSNQREQFIEPENDILGWFLYGVYRHCLETGNNTLRDDIWNQLKASADYIMNNIDTNGFGPQDFSIWEDMDNFGKYTYTQALYAVGLEAAAKMAAAKGLTSLADSYNGAASTIKSAINRDDTSATGLWYPAGGYYDRDIKYDNSVNRLKDTSALILFALGLIDIDSSRASSTTTSFESTLSSDTYGLARFGNDSYYTGDSTYSPSGDEALELSPSWPQMSCWNAINHVYSGDSTTALNILNWFKHRTGAGFMITGEAVSDVSEKPCVSTASEAVTAAAYVLAYRVLAAGEDLRLIPDQSNAGCFKNITVSAGCSGDWPQYQYVPYYVDNTGDSSDADTSAKKIYIANDGTYLYLRVDNESGILPGFNDPNKKFQVALYCEDFNGTDPTKTTSANGSELGRNMAYEFVRNSNSTTFDKYTVSNNAWTFNKNLSNGQFEWDTSTGRVEMKIPLSEIGSSVPGQDSWINMKIFVGKQVNQVWNDMDSINIHYRITGSTESWIYGDFE